MLRENFCNLMGVVESSMLFFLMCCRISFLILSMILAFITSLTLVLAMLSYELFMERRFVAL